MTLTLRQVMQSGDGGNGTTLCQYEVVGLPGGQSALIDQRSSVSPERWQLRYHRGGAERGQWVGEFASAQDALAALERRIAVRQRSHTPS